MMEKRHSRSWPWWPLALALLFTFLAHDLLMAAAPLTERGQAVHAHDMDAAIAATADGGPRPLHPTACGVSQPAVPHLWPLGDGAAARAFGGATALLTPQFVPSLLSDACEPPLTPSVRRALLQVYRI